MTGLTEGSCTNLAQSSTLRGQAKPFENLSLKSSNPLRSSPVLRPCSTTRKPKFKAEMLRVRRDRLHRRLQRGQRLRFLHCVIVLPGRDPGNARVIQPHVPLKWNICFLFSFVRSRKSLSQNLSFWIQSTCRLDGEWPEKGVLFW